jgi:hypothetical protein
MKAIFMTLAVAGLFSGCASPQHPIVLDSVGPASPQPASVGSNGSLVVYSAISVDMPSNRRPEHLHYTDYKILSDNGDLVQVVHNDYDNSWEGPRKVELPPGTYQVMASAYHYGFVTVPVVIVAHKSTVVHLDGMGSGASDAPRTRSSAVCLPNGQVVGWRSSPDKMARP